METYRIRSGVILALFLTKERMIYGGIGRIDPDYIKVPMSDEVHVKTIEGEKVAHRGDWIVKINEGEYMVFKDHIFKKLFTKI